MIPSPYVNLQGMEPLTNKQCFGLIAVHTMIPDILTNREAKIVGNTQKLKQ